MNIKDIEHMWKVASNNPNHDTNWHDPVVVAFAKLIAQYEREACLALHDHEDVLAPIGASAWGEAHQAGWAEGTAAYCEAIRARGQA
jgi:hypothetical protein